MKATTSADAKISNIAVLTMWKNSHLSANVYPSIIKQTDIVNCSYATIPITNYTKFMPILDHVLVLPTDYYSLEQKGVPSIGNRNCQTCTFHGTTYGSNPFCEFMLIAL